MEQRINSHSVSRIVLHFVWATKFRQKILLGSVRDRCISILESVCLSKDLRLVDGAAESDHIHLLVDVPVTVSASSVARVLKSHSSRLLRKEFPELQDHYSNKTLWQIGYGVWSSGDIDSKVIRKYLDHHDHNSFTNQ